MKRITLWTLTVAAAGMFLLAGSLKVIGEPTQVQLFGAIGLGQWFRYLTGSLEIAGAIGLLVPSASLLAALLLATVMIGAIATHLFVVGGSPLMAIVLLATTIAIACLRRESISSRVAVA
jgi:putative oxidoreductase